MICQERVDHLFGNKSNKLLLKKSKVDYRNHQSYIYQMEKEGFIYIQTQVNMLQEVLSTKFRMANQTLIAYTSKRLPEAARNYSITELEMCGLAINITSFAHSLKKVDFDAIVDHLALVHILKSKTEPATPRIKRLLEVLSAYSFNLYYMKGKDMILSDFLSRQEIDKSDPHEIIPISFDMKAILNEKYYKMEEEKSKYLVQT